MHKSASHRYFNEHSRYVIRKTSYSEWSNIYWFVLSQEYGGYGKWKDIYPNYYPLFQTKYEGIRHADAMIIECKKQNKFVIEQGINDEGWGD